jgi:hypothetical protein
LVSTPTSPQDPNASREEDNGLKCSSSVSLGFIINKGFSTPLFSVSGIFQNDTYEKIVV